MTPLLRGHPRMNLAGIYTKEKRMSQFDLRTLERQLRQKPELKKEYEKFLNQLPDEKNNSEEIDIQEQLQEETNGSLGAAPTFSDISEA